MTKITAFFQPKNATKKRELIGAPDAAQEGKEDGKSTSESSTLVGPTQRSANNKRIRQDDESENDEAVEKLLSHLTDETGNSWKKALQKQFRSSSFRRLAQFVDRERRQHSTTPIYPTVTNTWTALNCTPLENVRVVIVGQDPYHGPHQAHGLCFSVLPGNAPPPSLKNIYKELADDPDVDFPRSSSNNRMPRHGHLLRWAEQGVLLLNSVLTVRGGQPHSHKNRGWEEVTDAVLRAVVDRHCRSSNVATGGGRRGGCVFLLWGKPATSKALQLLGNSKNGKPQPPLHTVIATSHPSPLGARKTGAPFLGSRCFSRCNAALAEMGHAPIDWNVD